MSQPRHLYRQLISKRDELADRLARIDCDRTRANGPHDPDFAEQAQERENDEVLDRLAAATEADLLQVQHALDRLEDGYFGVCEQCGQAIEVERLAALPQATRCRACAAAHALPSAA